MDLDPQLKEAYQRVMGKPIESIDKKDASSDINKGVVGENSNTFPVKKVLIGLLILAAFIAWIGFWMFYFHIPIPFLSS